MKTHRLQGLQAEYARKREVEHDRIQKSLAVNNYFEKWGKITARYENWTTDKYYEDACKQVEKSKEKSLKDKRLEERREKLRNLIQEEKQMYEDEMKSGSRRSAGYRRTETRILEELNANLKSQNEERRRLEAEAKLYSQLRYGSEDATQLYMNSKTDHQVLAKLNWLDRKLLEKQQKDEETRSAEQTKLKLLEEESRRASMLQQRQSIRQGELNQLQQIQEDCLNELKQKEQENEILRTEEKLLSENVNRICQELKLRATEQSTMLVQSSSPNTILNLRKIKSIIRERFQDFHTCLKTDIEQLWRLQSVLRNESLHNLLATYEQQYNVEVEQNQTKFQNMYESEAKHSLMRCEEFWREENSRRDREIKGILNELVIEMSKQIDDNVHRQKELLSIRETMLNSLHETNQRIKSLERQQEKDVLPSTSLEITDLDDAKSLPVNNIKTTPRDSVGSIIKDFSEFYSRTDKTPPPGSARSVASSCDSVGSQPKFGRKKIAWN